MAFEGTYLRGRPGPRAITTAVQVLRQFLAAPQGASVRPRPTQSGDQIRLAVLDFTQTCSEPRGVVVGRSGEPLTPSFLVAHGSAAAAASFEQRPQELSNRSGSHLSSAGLFIAKQIVPSRFGTRLRMFGVCRGLNDNADARLIGMHPYRGNFVYRDDRNRARAIATSYGCPAVTQEVAPELMPMLDGGFIYIYDPRYTPTGFTDQPRQSRQHARVN
ncbi:MAG: murein L,D-transpeptidase catalytic domain family protein [Nannocystaceae bacterium]|nr:murein L,D-transpeptidase catalytic domain family protein [Nannocystaceae bacterium]